MKTVQASPRAESAKAVEHPFEPRAVYRMPSGRVARWQMAQRVAPGVDECTFIYDAPYGGPPPAGLAQAVSLSRANWRLPVLVA